ncbi:MAG: hypothetical protein ACI4TD_10110 [Phocaeicola sp.]
MNIVDASVYIMINRRVVLFVSHIISDVYIERYWCLRELLPTELYDVVWIITRNNLDGILLPEGVNANIYTTEDLNCLEYNPIGDTLIPGSPHFIPLRFFLDNPQYRHYWFIEYDVVFTGEWSTLMDDCDGNLDDYDFLSCHIEKYGEENREWPWWHRDNNCGYALEECVKGFNPICRYSNRALALLDRYMKEGHSAHSEVMITTCLHNHGMRIANIGGTGEFTPEGYRNRYYIKGVGINNGTMRWRPPFTMEEIEALGTKDRLFHPIK